MGNVESCCTYGASPRPDRTPKLKPGGAYRGTSSRANGHYHHQQFRNEFDGISPDPNGTDPRNGPSRSEESCGNFFILLYIFNNLKVIVSDTKLIF